MNEKKQKYKKTTQNKEIEVVALDYNSFGLIFLPQQKKK